MSGERQSRAEKDPARRRIKVWNWYYANAFLEIAEDSRATKGAEPRVRESMTAARAQFEPLAAHPYRFTSDDLLFELHARKAGIAPEERAAAREAFFSKGRACMRCSDLPRRYGWGIHFDPKARMALCAVDSAEYERYRNDCGPLHLKAMRGTRW